MFCRIAYAKGRAGYVVVDAGNICMNLDITKKIGTYSLAVLTNDRGAKLMAPRQRQHLMLR
ncbi:MAG: hypothetical protein A6F72_06260 [Cycloclasticus sp. symbiont of Poecilosclerida sp. N]|nr:MAG: hypothetical protein A6F72_06260 [Cycloclasticus sp. symbiont of Poecilosclerida sp. N]